MTFSEEFAKSHGSPIVVDGRNVIGMLRCDVKPDTKVRLTWRHAIGSPVQGIRMRLHGGRLAVADAELDGVVLWRDTAPDEMVLRCRSKAPAELRIWNCWRDA